MVRTLQRKFIVTAMVAITVLITVMLGTINGINLWRTSSENQRMLSALCGKGRAGDFKPEEDFSFDGYGIGTDTDITDRQTGEPPEPDMEQFQDDGSRTEEPDETGGKIKDDRNLAGKNYLHDILDFTITEDKTMAALYFKAFLDDEGNIVYIDTSRIFSVDEDTARELVMQVVSDDDKGNNTDKRGKLDGFRYMVSASEDSAGMTVVFLDVSSQIKSRLIVLFISVGIGIVSWLLMLLLVVLLSRKAIRPIAENIDRQRQFITDAGHEIKTPLAIIQTNTDALELRTGENKWSKNIRTQTVRLSGLMQQLLELSRMDEHDIVLNRENINLTVVVRDFLGQFEESMKEKDVTLETDIQENISIYANPDSISKIVNILIDNACHYCKTGGYIRVRLYKNDKHTVFKVENNSEEKLTGSPDRLFDRFYRGDTARTQRNGGYGIGLSIAKAAAAANGISIKAEYKTDEVIVFTVRI
jgi:hypothetical protein